MVGVGLGVGFGLAMRYRVRARDRLGEPSDDTGADFNNRSRDERFELHENTFSDFASIPALQQRDPTGHQTRLNLLVYVPSKRHMPLVLTPRDHRSLAVPVCTKFVIPQWGAVMIAQPPDGVTNGTGGPVRIDIQSERIMAELLQGVRELLGFPVMSDVAPRIVNSPGRWELDRYQACIPSE